MQTEKRLNMSVNAIVPDILATKRPPHRTERQLGSCHFPMRSTSGGASPLIRPPCPLRQPHSPYVVFMDTCTLLPTSTNDDQTLGLSRDSMSLKASDGRCRDILGYTRPLHPADARRGCRRGGRSAGVGEGARGQFSGRVFATPSCGCVRRNVTPSLHSCLGYGTAEYGAGVGRSGASTHATLTSAERVRPGDRRPACPP